MSDAAATFVGVVFLFGISLILLIVAVLHPRARQVRARHAEKAHQRKTQVQVVRRHSRTIPQDVKIAVSVRDGGKCRVCGSTKGLQYDHIYPWSLGGRSDDPNNIQLLCGYHNRLKSNR